MDALEQWLAPLGLAQLAPVLRANDVDLEILPELSEADLEKLGLSLGQRKKLLKAAASLSHASSAASSAAPAPNLGATASAERRQLTVMFCDLVGSTALSSRLDPEDLREVIGAYHQCATATVGRFDGFVAKYMGDGVLVYFGYPRAHEDDAERAVRAGLALVDAVGRLTPQVGVALRVRVGIVTGQVVVGDLIGEGAAREEAVVGETPNLAARLQAFAEPDSVVISPATRRLVSGLFECADLGAQELKGFAEPMHVWRVLGASEPESRFGARRAAGLTPLVGREEELALLLRCWERAKAGRGQVVLLSGEPGIGKSRLVRTLRERLSGEAHTPLRYQCSPYHVNSALRPVIDQLERAAGFARGDTAAAKLAKLEGLLARVVADVASVAPLVAALLSLPTGDRYPPLDLAPERQKELTLRALLDQLESLAATQPVLAVYEDAHWIDPSTLELLGLVVERVRGLQALVLITFRPEFAPPWTGHSYVTSLSLNRLGRRQGAALATRVTGGKALPAEVLSEVVAKTDGVPLFVEELTKAVLESGLLRDEGDRYALAGPLPPLAVPPTLQDSLMARLDRLASAKEVAQVGAAIGREFGHELLAAVAPLREGEVRRAVEQLVGAELVFRRGSPPDAIYSFKHALVRDVAYGTLLKSRRRQIHTRIAQALEERFPEQAEAQPELLAYHCAQAGLIEKAITYSHEAGRRAVARSAMKEGVAQLTAGLELLVSLPAGPERDHHELGLQVALGQALLATKGHAAPEVASTYARARELCRGEVDTPHLLESLSGLFTYNLHCRRASVAQEVAEEMLCIAERRQDLAARVTGHRVLGGSFMWRGALVPALAHFERALALYDQTDHHALMRLYASDTRMLCLGLTANILLWQGYLDQALVRSQRSLAVAHERSHSFTLAHALFLSCWFHQVRGDWRIVREHSARNMSLTEEHGFAHWHAHATAHHGWALAAGGSTAEGVAQMRDGLAAIRAAGMQLQMPYWLGLLAGTYTSTSRPTKALELLAEALAQADETDERWFKAELQRLKGEALLALSPDRVDEAGACYRQAITVARNQNARLWELRAASSLARLCRDQGRFAEAHDLLAPIYGWFMEGFDTPDLKEAKALLDVLADIPPIAGPARRGSNTGKITWRMHPWLARCCRSRSQSGSAARVRLRAGGPEDVAECLH